VSESRAGIPPELNSFVGRDLELAELRRLLPATRVLTLCGPGGIGKTRLALRLMADSVALYPDGVWLADLADLRQPELVVPRVAAVLGIREEPGRPLAETLAEALRSRRLLLALDTCEHLLDASAELCQLLLVSSAGVRLLVTSREPLHLAGETAWPVPPLSVPPAGTVPSPPDAWRYEAVRLFADRAAAALPGFALGPGNVAAVAAVCRALDGIPLAVELAAARVRALSVEQIAARLADRFGLLTTGNRGAPARQKTLRATLDWSHDLLTAGEQVLLRRLSVFAGWSLDMAEQVCSGDGIEPREVLDLLAGLVDKSLVAREPEVLGQARYRLLDTIREYAATRLAAAGESSASQHRLRDYALAVTEHNHRLGLARIPGRWPERADIFRRYDVDAANLWQVLSHCLAEGDAESGLRICAAVSPCWLVRGSFAEAGEWLDAFLALDPPALRAAVRGPALVARAQIALASGSAVAEPLAREGLAACQQAGDSFWAAAALNLLTEIAMHTGRAGDAASWADQALAVAQRAGDRWNEGHALGTWAALAARRGRLREAQQLGNASLTIMRRIDQQWGAARALLGLGDLARLRGDPGQARLRYRAALPILLEIDARPEIARCLAGLGRVAMDLGDLGLARRNLAESLRLSQATGSRVGMARGLEAFAALARQEHRPELAVRLAAAAASLRQAAGLPALPDARAEHWLGPGRRLSAPALALLWAEGAALDSEEAVALALGGEEPEAGEGVTVLATGRPAVLASSGAEPQATSPAGPAAVLRSTLTPRERQVAALIASGHSNRAIAEELVISPATAARHVANILAKLGFSSRTQIAAWAAGMALDPAAPSARPVAGRRA
jgi:predicted ATPase/DNA-binding CsgD family transcriptional regulator